MKARTVLAACTILCGLAAALLIPGLARADIGIQGPAYSVGTGGSPTTSKPESKLWFNDGHWWASMFVVGTGNYDIFRLDGSTWTDTHVVIDDRASTRQDVLSDGNTLYVASHKFQQTPVFSSATGNEMRLYRFTYTAGHYVLDDINPDPQDDFTVINGQRSEALVIDKDSSGQLWATWVQQASPNGAYHVYVNHTTTPCVASCSWAAATTLPGSTPLAQVSGDVDISSVIAFGSPSKNKIGVAWSDQVTSQLKFAYRDDAAADTAWHPVQVAVGGPKQVDDHINMKTANGAIYIASKTKFISKTALNPQTRLLVRSAAAGTWTAHTISYSPDQRTRPIVVLDTGNSMIHVFETGPHPSGADPEASGGDIFESTSRMSPISFAVLSRRPVIQDDDSPGMNNATSTKQNLDSTSDLAVVATNILTKRYWHHFEALVAPPPPPPSGTCTITGTSGPDIINGTSGPDVICGLGGSDIIRGFGGNDRLLGGGGGDRLYGGGGSDRLAGNFGSDRLVGGSRADTLVGGGGRDRLVGGAGRDVLRAGPGRDTLVARDRRRDLVSGGTGRDRARVDRIDVRRSIEVIF
jgi:RTX calcium-binding nonapeptide repeat (4 copies)